MAEERYVEGRLAFSVNLPSYAKESVAVDLNRILDLLTDIGVDVRALDTNIVTKEVSAEAN